VSDRDGDRGILPEFGPAEPLPGMGPWSAHDSKLRQAAHRSIVALSGAGYLDERHAVITQLILDLADVVDAGRRQGRASSAAMAAAQLIAAYQLLVPEAKGGEGNGALDELVAEIRRGAATARDPLDARPAE
jgi:hypothetical protein